MKLNVVTIDGPSASGKGSLARNLAEYLDFSILDSGLLYRVYAYFHNLNLDIAKIPLLIQKDISFKFNHKDVIVLNDQEDITSELRSEKMAKKA